MVFVVKGAGGGLDGRHADGAGADHCSGARETWLDGDTVDMEQTLHPDLVKQRTGETIANVLYEAM